MTVSIRNKEKKAQSNDHISISMDAAWKRGMFFMNMHNVLRKEF